jgi:hypothetical protein
MKAAENAIASTGDMSSGCDTITGASGKGDSILFIELVIGIAKPHAGADLVGVTASGWVEAIQEAYVEEDAAGVVADEVFVTMSAGANGRP